MKLKSDFFLLALIMGAFSCSPRGDKSVSIVDVNGHKMAVLSLNNLKSDTATILLSNLVEDCVFVQLETNDDAFFNPWFTTVTEKYIGVRDIRSEPYKLFDRSGKFLCNVGARGKGPGEYSITPYDDIIDDQNGLIYLAPSLGENILVYNTSGQFLKNIVAPERLLKAKLFLSSNILTVFHMPLINNHAMAYQFDIHTGMLLEKMAALEHLRVSSADGEIINTRNVPDAFDLLHTSSDTLYQFSVESNRILPLFTSVGGAPESFKQYFILNGHIILTNIMAFETNPETGRPGFVPKGLVGTDLKNMTSSYIKIVNDFYGNLTVSANAVRFRNGHFVYNVQPEQLMDEIERRLAERSCTENDRQVLRQTLSRLKENTNNVVLAGKMRKEYKMPFRDF